jgi:hypothetical protein
MITVTLGVVCYTTAASRHDDRVVLVSLKVAEDPAPRPPPPHVPPRRAPSAAAGSASVDQAVGAPRRQQDQVAAGPSRVTWIIFSAQLKPLINLGYPTEHLSAA